MKANLRQVEKLWDEFYQNRALAPLLATSYTKVQVQCLPEKEKELDVLAQLGQDLNKYLQPSSRDKYQDYID